MRRSSGCYPIQIACDGGCRGNAQRENIGGYGVVVNYPNSVHEIYGYELNTTNNIMELTACLVGLCSIRDKTMGVEVILDSAYVLNGIIEWSTIWIQNDWKTKKGTDVKNKDIWMPLIAEVHKFKSIKFTKCKGHSDNVMNNRADRLANKAMDDFVKPF